MRIKRYLSILLAVCFIAAALPFFVVKSGALFSVRLGMASDYGVFAPGVYDLYVVTDAEEPTYQWYAHVGPATQDEDYLPLEETENYRGTKTSHMSLKVHDGLAYTGDGSGWDNIYFSCRVTDKYGKSSFGPDVNMIIFTHQSMLDRLEKEDVKINSFKVTNSVMSREIDGVTYYDVYADQGILTTYSYGLIDDKLAETLDDSEVVIKSEEIITEGGSTVELKDERYYPKRIGMGAVQVTVNLVLYQDGQRMETIDSKTCVVNTLTPDGVGAACTTSATSLYDSMSFHQVTLTNLPKGTYVRLIQNNGSYWKVAANGYIGYVPTTALSVMENIRAVALTVQEPTADVASGNSVVLDSNNEYMMEPRFNQEIWHDDTAGRFLSANDKFVAGHEYTLQVWLTAKGGKRFHVVNGDPDVSGWVNGVPARVIKAYEQDPEEVIEVCYRFTHVHDLTKVNRVYPTCTEAGKEYHYRCSGCGWAFEDYQGKVKITDESWGVIPALGHRESYWISNGTEHYKVCQRRECGLTLYYTKGAHTGGSATCTSGAHCEVCGLEYGAKASHKWSDEWNFSDKSGHAHYCTYLCGEHSAVQPHRPGKEATATEPQVCLDCGYIIKNTGTHTHAIEKIEKKDATCTEPGNKEYYKCSSCSKIFSDKDGKSEITEDSVKIAALGHKTSKEWKLDGETHWHLCERCGEVIGDTKAAHDFKGEEEKCSVCGYIKGADTVATETDTGVPDDTADTGPAETSPAETETDAEKPGEESGDKGGSNAVLIILIVFLVTAAALGAVAYFIIRRNKKNSGK